MKSSKSSESRYTSKFTFGRYDPDVYYFVSTLIAHDKVDCEYKVRFVKSQYHADCLAETIEHADAATLLQQHGGAACTLHQRGEQTAVAAQGGLLP